MNKKGFTLIELLAVIVILAVIAIIVTPMIMSTILGVRRNAFKSSAVGIVSSAEQYYYQKQVKGESFYGERIDLTTTTALQFNGQRPKAGVIVIDADGSITLQMNDGTTCVNKRAGSDEYVLSDDVSNCDGTGVQLATLDSCFDITADGTLTKYTCRGLTNVIVPAKIHGITVKKINMDVYNSFTDGMGQNYACVSSIDTLDLSRLSELTEIINVFKGCINNLIISGLPKLETISNFSFSGCQINNATISNLPALKTIGESAFSYSKLQNVTINNLPSLTSIGKYSFSDNSIETINISNMPSLTIIGEFAFSDNKISSITLSNLPLLKTIKNNAFFNNKITTVNLVNLPQLKDIGEFAFERIKKQYDDTNGNKVVENYCTPTYNFDNVPSISAYDSATSDGLNPNAFADYYSKCTPTIVGTCEGETAPIVNYNNTVSNELKNAEIFTAVGGC